MARKRGGGRGRRAKAYRTPSHRVTCRGCGQVQTTPVRPPPGVELFCVECTAKQRQADRDEAAAVAS